MAFTSLSHHIDLEWLEEAYRRTRKDGAPGIDGQTAREYEEHLGANLQSLLDRAKSGRYRAPAVKRGYVPKGDGSEQRPIGIPTFEDKVLQRAITMVLEAVYEQDFLDCSFGFRPKRSAHDALECLREALRSNSGGWVLEVDVRKYFDTIDRSHMRNILRHRVHDGVLLRLIGKWLHAGVMEEGRISYPETGTPQGGVISPILANIYLHHVLDVWFAREVRPRLRGRSYLIRYADDFVIAFEIEDDARKVQDALAARFRDYGLALHPEKTRLIEYQRPQRRGPRQPGSSQGPGTFDFLGFTHYWALSRRGNWVVKRKTAADRFRRSVRSVSDWCRTHRHLRVKEQRRHLASKLNGHCQYYGITGNSRALSSFRHHLTAIWQKWLNRRSQRRRMTWDRFQRLLERHPLPPARCVHSTYGRPVQQTLDAQRGWRPPYGATEEPDASIAHVRI